MWSFSSRHGCHIVPSHLQGRVRTICHNDCPPSDRPARRRNRHSSPSCPPSSDRQNRCSYPRYSRDPASLVQMLGWATTRSRPSSLPKRFSPAAAPRRGSSQGARSKQQKQWRFFSSSLGHSTFVTSYLITLSARASTAGGIVRPICFAVFRLITNSNFVGCSTGSSAGFAPFRILSTYVAARRNKSG